MEDKSETPKEKKNPQERESILTYF